jgi:uncharacterized protein
MAIKINDIPPEGLTVEIEETLDLFDDGKAMTPCKASLTIMPASPGTFRVAGTVSAAAKLECSRCLKPFDFPVRDAAVAFELVPGGSVRGGAEHELGRGELDTEFYEGDEIEPRDLVREQLLLAIPMVPVHREDCKGLCPACGADRNEGACGCEPQAIPEKENPFAVLKKIIKPEKE